MFQAGKVNLKSDMESLIDELQQGLLKRSRRSPRNTNNSGNASPESEHKGERQEDQQQQGQQTEHKREKKGEAHHQTEEKGSRKHEMLLQAYIDSMQNDYVSDLQPLFDSKIFEKLGKINTMEQYIKQNLLPDDLDAASGSLLGKAYIDLSLYIIDDVLDFKRKWNEQQGVVNPKMEALYLIPYFLACGLEVLQTWDPRNYEGFDDDVWFIEVFQPMRCFYEENETSCKKFDFLATILSDDIWENFKDNTLSAFTQRHPQGRKADHFNVHVQHVLGWYNIFGPGTDEVGKLLPTREENLPSFEEFYGQVELAKFRKVWNENPSLTLFYGFTQMENRQRLETGGCIQAWCMTALFYEMFNTMVSVMNRELDTAYKVYHMILMSKDSLLTSRGSLDVICNRYKKKYSHKMWTEIVKEMCKTYENLYDPLAKFISENNRKKIAAAKAEANMPIASDVVETREENKEILIAKPKADETEVPQQNSEVVQPSMPPAPPRGNSEQEEASDAAEGHIPRGTHVRNRDNRREYDGDYLDDAERLLREPDNANNHHPTHEDEQGDEEDDDEVDIRMESLKQNMLTYSFWLVIFYILVYIMNQLKSS